MNRVLIIDRSMMTSLFLAGEIKKELDLDIITSNSLKQTREILEKKELISAAIVEPELADDPSGELVDLLLEHHIPVIVYTSALSAALLESLLQKPIVDYVIKSSRNNFFIVINLLGQVLRHRQTAILVIDDSPTSLMQIREALKNLKLHIIEAGSAEEAMQKIKEHPEIKLVLTDYSMEGQSGIELTQEIRKKYSNKELSIIGISAYGNPLLSADFLKNGANDFILKPFQKEEFVSRVLLQLDMIDYIETIKESSEKDFLTGIYNRKYVYEVGRKLFDNAKRGNITLACAMIDIDHFKRVNDTYGHDIGDKVIVRLAQELRDLFRKSDIVGRLGGEEFCVVLTNPDMAHLESIFDDLRQTIEKLVIQGMDEQKRKFGLSFTVSIGLTSTLSESFEEMLKVADLKLYEAKSYGRNRVVI